jgi:hypothetical protein
VDSGSTDMELKEVIGYALRIGVLTSTLLILAGLVLIVVKPPAPHILEQLSTPHSPIEKYLKRGLRIVSSRQEKCFLLSMEDSGRRLRRALRHLISVCIINIDSTKLNKTTRVINVYIRFRSFMNYGMLWLPSRPGLSSTPLGPGVLRRCR